MTSQNVAVFDLESMGYGTAAARFRAEEGGRGGELAAIAPGLDAAVVVVLNAAQTESVLFGETGVVAMMKPGAAATGLGHEDDAAITKVYARNAGLRLPGER